jgi:hypothetical protein
MNYSLKIDKWNDGKVEYWNSGFIFQFVKATNLRLYSINPTFHPDPNDLVINEMNFRNSR